MQGNLYNRVLKLEKTLDSMWKKAALDVVLSNNPMHDDYHVGIRSISDILTLDEALDNEPPTNPDVSDDYIQQCIESGMIKIYSSNKIRPGTFVTPSAMMARDYAGSQKIYSKTVGADEVAWINCDEGIFVGKLDYA